MRTTLVQSKEHRWHGCQRAVERALTPCARADSDRCSTGAPVAASGASARTLIMKGARGCSVNVATPPRTIGNRPAHATSSLRTAGCCSCSSSSRMGLGNLQLRLYRKLGGSTHKHTIVPMLCLATPEEHRFCSTSLYTPDPAPQERFMGQQGGPRTIV